MIWCPEDEQEAPQWLFLVLAHLLASISTIHRRRCKCGCIFCEQSALQMLLCSLVTLNEEDRVIGAAL